MKKAVGILLALIIMCSCLIACDLPFITKDVDINGTWVAQSFGTQQIKASAEFLGVDSKKMGKLTFTKDSKVTGYILGQHKNGTYSKDKKSVTLTFGKTIYKGTLDGDKLSIMINKQELVMAKEDK
jgi:hypothetical protein